jgi:hypothetical protein
MSYLSSEYCLLSGISGCGSNLSDATCVGYKIHMVPAISGIRQDCMN